MKHLLALLVCLCAGSAVADDSTLFSSPAVPLNSMPQNMGFDLIWGDKVGSEDPRFQKVLKLEATMTELAELDSLGYVLAPELSHLSVCQTLIPGKADTVDMDYVQLTLRSKEPENGTAFVILMSLPERSFTFPPMSYIETYVDPNDSTYTKMTSGVDADGNDRCVWTKFRSWNLFGPPPE
ncbi:MAG: hypothetical protein GY867_08660 [bacterium]|nr:hypothetical protein [bacterium]